MKVSEMKEEMSQMREEMSLMKEEVSPMSLTCPMSQTYCWL